jgi:hypothetical protein
MPMSAFGVEDSRISKADSGRKPRHPLGGLGGTTAGALAVGAGMSARQSRDYRTGARRMAAHAFDNAENARGFNAAERAVKLKRLSRVHGIGAIGMGTAGAGVLAGTLARSRKKS